MSVNKREIRAESRDWARGKSEHRSKVELWASSVESIRDDMRKAGIL